MTRVGKILTDYMDDYNMNHTNQQHLVFFKDAIYHIARIARMLRSPRGNALLVGVGGTGKQSLTRMSSYICAMECIQIEIKRGYGYSDFREDLKQLYFSAGQDN